MGATTNKTYWNGDSQLWASAFLFGLAWIVGFLAFGINQTPDDSAFLSEAMWIHAFLTMLAITLFFIAFGLFLSLFKVIGFLIAGTIVLAAPQSLPLFLAAYGVTLLSTWLIEKKLQRI